MAGQSEVPFVEVRFKPIISSSSIAYIHYSLIVGRRKVFIPVESQIILSIRSWWVNAMRP